jgi:hypothetical protein
MILKIIYPCNTNHTKSSQNVSCCVCLYFPLLTVTPQHYIDEFLITFVLWRLIKEREMILKPTTFSPSELPNVTWQWQALFNISLMLIFFRCDCLCMIFNSSVNVQFIFIVKLYMDFFSALFFVISNWILMPRNSVQSGIIIWKSHLYPGLWYVTREKSSLAGLIFSVSVFKYAS